MSNKVLNELNDIKNILARLIGTADLQPEEQFSKEAIDKAAKAYQKLQIERGEWVEDSDISKFIRSAPYRPGWFLIKELGFTAYFKKGHYFYFQKKALQALAEELKLRNINLARYMELKADQERFKKAVSKVASSKGRKTKKPYEFPSDLRDITTSSIPVPSVELVREDLKRLKEEFLTQTHASFTSAQQPCSFPHSLLSFVHSQSCFLQTLLSSTISSKLCLQSIVPSHSPAKPGRRCRIPHTHYAQHH